MSRGDMMFFFGQHSNNHLLLDTSLYCFWWRLRHPQDCQPCQRVLMQSLRVSSGNLFCTSIFTLKPVSMCAVNLSSALFTSSSSDSQLLSSYVTDGFLELVRSLCAQSRNHSCTIDNVMAFQA